MADYPYCTTQNGIKICSNIPLDQKPAGHYNITINSQLPIWSIALMGGLTSVAMLEAQFSEAVFISNLTKQGYTGQIKNYQVNIDWWGNTINIQFDASSPGPFAVALVILAILVAIGVIAYIVYMTVDVISKNPAMSTGFGAMEIALAIGIIGAVGYVIYKELKKKKV